MVSIFNSLATGLKHIIADRKGNIAITFAIVLVPIFAAAGAAVDYSRLSNEHSHLQEALDSAVLAAASAGIKTEEKRIALGQKYFRTNTRNPCDSEATIIIKNSQVFGTASCQIKTTFLGIVGFDKFTIDGRSVAGIADLANQEIVLVLDYSGSMKQRNKYRTMRDAAMDLVSSISSSPGSGKVKVGLVPFSQHVYATMKSDFVINEDPGGTWTNCTMDRGYPYNTTEQTPISVEDNSKWGIDINGSADPFNDISKWANRKSKAAKNTKRNKRGKKGKNAADPYAECSEYRKNALIVQPLTSNHSAIISQLKAMTPYRSTHIPLGLSFGWHVISPDAPFTQGASYLDKKTRKTIILLTDGKQTQEAWGPDDSWTRKNGEDNLERLCAGIKKKDIKMITVAFDLDDEPTVERLKQCASGAANFYDAENTSQLIAAFSDISTSLFDQARLVK